MLDTFFPILMYVLGTILLIGLIVLVIKLIYTVDKTNSILDDVEDKIKTLDGLFYAIDKASSTVSSLSDRFLDTILSIANRFRGKKRRKKIEKEEDDIYE